MAKLVSVCATHVAQNNTPSRASRLEEAIQTGKEPKMSENEQRFVALDVHKNYVVVGAVNVHQEVVLHPHRVSLSGFGDWAQKHLHPADAVVLEATTNAWYIHDVLEPLVARVVVANPAGVKLIAAAVVKTDKRDTLALARLLAAKMIPEVWVPPHHVRELRSLVAHRKRLISQRTTAMNRLHSLLQRHNLAPPPGEVFSPANSDWWKSLPISDGERLRASQDLDLVDHISPLIQAVDEELARQSINEKWVDQTTYLIQLPGIALLNAMTILGAIGDISRFPTAKKLVGYSGLGSKVHASGQTHRTGGITKQGRSELRQAMVEAAWVAVRTHPHWEAEFTRLGQRIGKNKAIAAIARKLLVVIWHVLSAQVPDRRADPEIVARYLFRWGTQHRLATHQGLSRAEFVRQELDRLGLGQGMEQFEYGSRVYKLPSSNLALDQPALSSEKVG
jgi:transposase